MKSSHPEGKSIPLGGNYPDKYTSYQHSRFTEEAWEALGKVESFAQGAPNSSGLGAEQAAKSSFLSSGRNVTGLFP